VKETESEPGNRHETLSTVPGRGEKVKTRPQRGGNLKVPNGSAFTWVRLPWAHFSPPPWERPSCRILRISGDKFVAEKPKNGRDAASEKRWSEVPKLHRSHGREEKFELLTMTRCTSTRVPRKTWTDISAGENAGKVRINDDGWFRGRGRCLLTIRPGGGEKRNQGRFRGTAHPSRKKYLK